ncbi:MAG: MFS transporter, partial [Saprospiraceae bacterium]|nr:MFS transporter [Saprospiraceae bacterium]
MEILSSYRDISGRIWLLAMVNFINRCGGMIMCFLSLYITESLHYKLTTAGIAMSFYGIGAVFGQQVGGYLSDKIGYQRVQLWSLMGTGIMILVLMQVRNFYLLCFVLFIQNLVSEAFRPANSVAITANSDLSTRTRSFSLLRVAFNLAITIALSVGGWLITKGWNYVFWVDSFTCFASALTLYFFVPEVHRITKEQRRENKLIVANNASPYKDKTYMRFIFASFLGALAFMQIIWTIPPFFKNVYHWNESQIGLISALNGAVVMLIELPMVSKLEKMMSKLKIIKIGLLVYGLSYLTLT